MFDVYSLRLRLGGLGGEHAPRAWKTQHREENRKTSTFANNQTRFHHVTLAPADPRLFGGCFWDIVLEGSMMKTSRCTHNNHIVGEEAFAFLFI